MKKIYIVYLILGLFFATESNGQLLGLSSGELTGNDILIAQDSIHSLTYDEQTVWAARRMLMEKLLKDTALISEDTSVTAFYNAYKSDNIGLLSQVRVGMDTLYNIDSTARAAIESNLGSIQSSALAIAYDDSILANDTTLGGEEIAGLELDIQTYSGNIADNTAYNKTAYNSIESIVNARAAAIKDENAALSSSLIYEQNEIAVNNIYLSTVAIRQSDSIISYATQLYNIASQCALNGGAAVYGARSLYHAINDSILFNDDQICGSSSDTCLVPPAPGFISGSFSSVCGEEFSYAIDSMINVSGYTWTVTGNATIDSGQSSTKLWVSFADTFSTGTISVYATDSCGSGTARSLAIMGYPSAPTSITGATAVCAFETGVSFSIDSVTSASSYTWVVPSGCAIDSGQGTTRIVVDWDSVPGNVIVVASDSCGSSDSTFYVVGIAECRMANHKMAANSTGEADVKIYPNPTTGTVTVIYHLSSDKGLLELYDVIGELVGSFQLNENTNIFEFDASYLCCGIFQYRVMDNETLKGQGKLVIIK